MIKAIFYIGAYIFLWLSLAVAIAVGVKAGLENFFKGKGQK